MATNSMGETPLHKSVLNPSTRVLMCKELLENGSSVKGFDVNVANNKGDTPLHYCVHLKRRDLSLLLLQHGANMHLKVASNPSPMELATSLKATEVLELFQAVDDIRNFLANLKLEHLTTTFLKEGLFLDELKYCTEDIFKGMDVKIGDRVRLIEALKKEKRSDDVPRSVVTNLRASLTGKPAKTRLGALQKKKKYFFILVCLVSESFTIDQTIIV